MMTDSMYYMYVNVLPICGPDPVTGASNWTGNYITGRLYSYADYDYTRIYGWNIPVPAMKIPVEGIAKERPRKTHDEIINSLNQAFK